MAIKASDLTGPAATTSGGHLQLSNTLNALTGYEPGEFPRLMTNAMYALAGVEPGGMARIVAEAADAAQMLALLSEPPDWIYRIAAQSADTARMLTQVNHQFLAPQIDAAQMLAQFTAAMPPVMIGEIAAGFMRPPGDARRQAPTVQQVVQRPPEPSAIQVAQRLPEQQKPYDYLDYALQEGIWQPVDVFDRLLQHGDVLAYIAEMLARKPGPQQEDGHYSKERVVTMWLAWLSADTKKRKGELLDEWCLAPDSKHPYKLFRKYGLPVGKKQDTN